MSDLEKFKIHLEKQVNHLYSIKHCANEVRHITKLLELTEATEFIEYGTWAGLLPKMILERNPQLQKFTGVDAVPLYLEISKKFVSDSRFEILPALIYNDMTIPYLDAFHVGFNDSIESSSLFTNRTDRRYDNTIVVPTGPLYHARNFLPKRFPKLINDRSYVMMDLDGIDATFIDCYLDEMIRTGIHPKVLQFELWESCHCYFPDIKKKFESCGYKIPEDIIDFNKGLATVAISKEHWWSYQTTKEGVEPSKDFWKSSW